MLHGWIMLHRKMLDNWVAQEPELLAMWVRLLLDANHTDTKRMFNGCHIEIKRGQLIFGLNAFSIKSGISEAKVRRYISLLEKDGMISRLKTNKYSLISIVNFDSYQCDVRQTTGESQANDIQSSGKQQHRNNDNNVNNKEPGNKLPDDAPKKSPSKAKGLTEFPDGFEITESMVEWFTEQDFKYIDLGRATDKWVDAMKAKGSRYKDWTAAWRNGMNNAEKWSVPK